MEDKHHYCPKCHDDLGVIPYCPRQCGTCGFDLNTVLDRAFNAMRHRRHRAMMYEWPVLNRRWQERLSS